LDGWKVWFGFYVVRSSSAWASFVLANGVGWHPRHLMVAMAVPSLVQEDGDWKLPYIHGHVAGPRGQELLTGPGGDS